MPYKKHYRNYNGFSDLVINTRNEHTTHDECNLLNSWIFKCELDDCKCKSCKYYKRRKILIT